MKINMHRAKDTGEKSCETEAERIVQKYLDSFLEQHDDSINDSMEQTFNRVVCCETSSSLYCNKCCNLLVPDGSLPEPISLRRSTTQQHDNNHSKEGRRLQLPFNLHIVLDDRRGSATGLHAKVLLNNGMGKDQVDSTISNENIINADSINTHNANLGSVKLFDVAKNDEIPQYCHKDDSAASTYLLFPCPGESIPLESVSSNVQTLVVLDVKWTKSGIYRKNMDLARLQKVHLSSPPRESYYWRWHNAGPGRISTIEAIYYAAYEIYQHVIESGNTSSQSNNVNDLVTDQRNLIHLLWLFGHQRAATFRSAKIEGLPPPCTDEGKAKQREMKKQKGTWRQLRHEEDERRLREKNRLKEETRNALG